MYTYLSLNIPADPHLSLEVQCWCIIAIIIGKWERANLVVYNWHDFYKEQVNLKILRIKEGNI